jgi:hypothetical protein
MPERVQFHSQSVESGNIFTDFGHQASPVIILVEAQTQFRNLCWKCGESSGISLHKKRCHKWDGLREEFVKLHACWLFRFPQFSDFAVSTLPAYWRFHACWRFQFRGFIYMGIQREKKGGSRLGDAPGGRHEERGRANREQSLRNSSGRTQQARSCNYPVAEQQHSDKTAKHSPVYR